MLVSSSDGCCLDGLVAAILLRAAAMIAVGDGVGGRDAWVFGDRVVVLTLVRMCGSLSTSRSALLSSSKFWIRDVLAVQLSYKEESMGFSAFEII